jgi:hypothetical protein
MNDQPAAQDKDLYSYDSFGVKKTTSQNNNFWWWCAGAYQRILKQYPSEQTKYAGLGGVLVATFVLATLSAGYAIHSIFNNWFWTIFFALAWGLIIFNFDRFLVSTMRKYGVSRSKQIWMAVPRILLALLIGVTIARPLELKVFEQEINVKMVENMHQKMQRNDSLLHIQNLQQELTATGERDRLLLRRQAIEDTLRQLQTAYVQEADGTGGSGQRGIEQITRLKKEAYDAYLHQSLPELNAIKLKAGAQDSILLQANTSLQDKRNEYQQTLLANVGFLERNKALSDLANEENSVFWATFLISLLIILIETGPILSKLIMPVGPYDVALAREELLQMAASENDIRKGKEMVFEKKKRFYEKQKDVSDQLVDKLTEIQQKNIDDELLKWEQGQWQPKDHRPSMDEVMRKIKKQYSLDEDDLI